jgi:tetratricopeptide (TPR) repeat protein
VLLLCTLSGLSLARLASGVRSPKPQGAAARTALALGSAACLWLTVDAVRLGAGDFLRTRWEDESSRLRDDLALETARRAVTLDPGHAAARIRIGEILANQAFWLRRQPDRIAFMLEEAESNLTRVLKDNPLEPDARCALARVRLLQGRPDEAAAEMETVVKNNPVLVYYALQQARLLVDAKNHRAALAAFERARKLDFYDESAWAGVHSMKRKLGLPISVPNPPPRPEPKPAVEPGQLL